MRFSVSQTVIGPPKFPVIYRSMSYVTHSLNTRYFGWLAYPVGLEFYLLRMWGYIYKYNLSADNYKTCIFCVSFLHRVEDCYKLKLCNKNICFGKYLYFYKKIDRIDYLELFHLRPCTSTANNEKTDINVNTIISPLFVFLIVSPTCFDPTGSSSEETIWWIQMPILSNISQNIYHYYKAYLLKYVLYLCKFIYN